MNNKKTIVYDRIRSYTATYDRKRQSFYSVNGISDLTLSKLRFFLRPPYTKSVSRRFPPYTLTVHGDRLRWPFISVYHRKRPFTTVRIRPGVVPFGELADELRIHIEPASDKTSIILTCNDSNLPTDNRNLAYRAAEAFMTHIDKPFRIDIDLLKHVPSEAGLGGGSSDGAAVLRALNAYFNQTIDRSTLTIMAARLGSDVPLFLAEKPVRMRGCGEIIESLDFELPEFWGVLVHPGTGVSTARAYALLDAVPNRQPGTSTEQLLSCLRDRKKTSLNVSEFLATGLSNDFECVVLDAYPHVAKAYEMIVASGALRALLCGSGAAVFGLARDIQHAKQLVDTLVVHFSFVALVSSASVDAFHIKQL